MVNFLGFAAVVLIQFFTWTDASSQGFFGLSINYGDALTFTPHTDLLLNRKSFSPTLVYSHQLLRPSKFGLVVGVQSGVMGHQLVPELSYLGGSGKNRYPIVEYGNFVSRIEVIPGKVMRFNKKKLFVGIGGGVSYYLLFPFTSIDVYAGPAGSLGKHFSAYIEAPNAGSLVGFVKVYAKISLSDRCDMAVQYSRHRQSIMTGEYEFLQTSTATKGSISLVPQGVSFMLLYRLKRRMPDERMLNIEF